MIIYPNQKVYLSADIDHTKARAARNNRSVFKWCRQSSLISVQDQEAWKESLSKRDDVKMFSVRAIDMRQVGVCGLTSIDKQNQRAEFSLYIHKEEQSQGFGHSALFTLLRHGFEDLNLIRIWGETMDGNPAIEMFQSLGLKHEGTLRKAYYKGGLFLDSKIIAALREEWLPSFCQD